jgi:hypothetical protein
MRVRTKSRACVWPLGPAFRSARLDAQQFTATSLTWRKASPFLRVRGDSSARYRLSRTASISAINSRDLVRASRAAALSSASSDHAYSHAF